MADEIISLSRIESYLFCGQAYVLDGKLKQNDLPISGFDAETEWLEQSFRKLVSKAADKASIKELKGATLAAVLWHQYRSAEKFGNEKKGEWSRRFIDERKKFYGRDIVWLYPNHWLKEAHEIKNACMNYYSHLLKEGVPLDDLTDTTVITHIDGHDYTTKLDAISSIRPGGVIEEIRMRKVTQAELNEDWSITPKLLAIYTLAQSEPYSTRWQIRPKSLSDMRYRHFSAYNGRSYETTRSDADVNAAARIISDTNDRIAREDFPPNHKNRNCETCRYNVLKPDNKAACEKRDKELRIMKPMNQLIR